MNEPKTPINLEEARDAFDRRTDHDSTAARKDFYARHPNMVNGGTVNPVEFMDDDQMNQEAVSFDDMMKAVRFGCPELCNQLCVTYARGGLKALGAISKLLTYWMAVKGAVDGSVAVDAASIVFNITVAGDFDDK